MVPLLEALPLDGGGLGGGDASRRAGPDMKKDRRCHGPGATERRSNDPIKANSIALSVKSRERYHAIGAIFRSAAAP